MSKIVSEIFLKKILSKHSIATQKLYFICCVSLFLKYPCISVHPLVNLIDVLNILDSRKYVGATTN